MAVTLNNSQISAGLYSAFWNRAADYTGQQHWVGVLNANAMTPLQVATEFYNAPEGKGAYPEWIRTNPTALVTQVYESVFERAPDAGGLAFYVNQINSGTSFPQVVLNMMYNALNSGNTDGMQFANEIQVSQYVAEVLRTDDPAITSVALDGVTADPQSVVIREAQLDEMVDPANTYTLTTSIDIATAQYFDGSLNSFGQQTLQSFDQLTGQKTFNVLDAEITNNVTPALLDNIQSVRITNLDDAAAHSISLLNANAVEEVVNDASLYDLTFNNVGATATFVGVENTARATTVNYATTTGAQEIELGLSNVTGAAAVTIAGVETVNVLSVNATNSVDLELAAATTLTIDGDANLTVAELSAGGNTIKVSSVDASNLTGNLTLDMGAQSGVLSTTDISVTGGQGNDTITMSAISQDYVVTLGAGNDTVVDTNISNTRSIEGGEGTDTLSTDDASARGLTTVNGINGIDVVKLTDALSATLTTANVDSTVNTVTLAASAGALTSGAAAITGPAGELTVNLGSSVGGALGSDLTLTDTGTATTDVLNINNLSISGSTQVNAFGTGRTVTSSGYENVNINTGTGSPVAQTIGTLSIQADAASAPVNLTLEGQSPVDITALTTNSTGLTTVDASGLGVLVNAAGLTLSGTTLGALGTQSITGSAGADIVTVGNFASTIDGGTGNDILTGSTLADSIRGGQGNDILSGAGGNDTIHGNEGNDDITATVAGVVSIEGGAGNDTVSMGATLGNTDVVNGNEGTDTLSVTDGITGTTGVGITNFEILQTTADQVMSNAVNNTWNTVFGDAATLNITNASAMLNTYQLDNTATGTHTFDRLTDTGTDSLTIQPVLAAGVTNAQTISMTQFTADDEESITIDNSAGASRTGSLTIGTLHADDLTSLTLTGDNAITITNAITTTGGTNLSLATVNASAMTAAVDVDASNSVVAVTMSGAAAYGNTLTGGFGADTITGGSAADSLTGNNGADNISSGAGNDVVLGGQGADVVSTSTGLDSVTAGTGADTVTLSVDGETDTINQAASDSAAATATNFAGATFAAGDTITFGNGVDVINNFKAGATSAGGDILNIGTSSNTSLLSGSTSSATIGWLSGTFANGVFTVAANGVGPDTLVLQGSSLSSSTTRAVVLAGVDSDNLDPTNFSGTDTSIYTPGVAFSVTTATGAFNPTTTYASASAARAAGVSTVAGSAGVTDTITTPGDASSVTFNFNTGVISGATDASVNQLVYQSFDTFTAGTGAGAASVTDAAGVQNVNIRNAVSNTLVFSGGGADVLANTGSGTTTTTLSAATGSLASTASGSAASTITVTGAASTLTHTNTGTGTDNVVVGASANGVLSYTASNANTNTGNITFNRAITGSDVVAFHANDTGTLTLNVGQTTTTTNGVSGVDYLELRDTVNNYNLTLADGDLAAAATIRNVSGSTLAGNVTIDSALNGQNQTINLNNGTTYTGTGNFTLNGGKVNTVNSGSGSDTVTIAVLDGSIESSVLATNLGNGTNVINATLATGSISDSDVTIVGGTGNDSVTFTSAGALTFAADASDLQAQNNVTFNGTSTGTVSWTSAAADITEALTVTVGSGITGAKAFDFSDGSVTAAITGSFYSTAGATADKFIADDGGDTLTVYGGGGVTNSDTLVGGGGTDTLTFNLNGSALSDDVSGVAATTFGGWETINIANTSATAATAVFTVENTTNQAGLTLIDASQLAAGNGATLSNATGTTAITIKGGAGDDNITGGTAGDTLYTSSGVNTVAGGLGVDTINLDAPSNQVDAVKLGAGQFLSNATSFGTTMAEGTDIVNGFDWSASLSGDYVQISKDDLQATGTLTLIDAVTGTTFASTVGRGSLVIGDVANGQAVTSTTQQAFRLTTGASTAADALGLGGITIKTDAFASTEGLLVLWYDTDTSEVVFTAVNGSGTSDTVVVAADFSNTNAADMYRIGGYTEAQFVGLTDAQLANSIAIIA